MSESKTISLEEILNKLANIESACDQLKQYVFMFKHANDPMRQSLAINEISPSQFPQFPAEIGSMLFFTDEKEYVKVRPRQFLGSDTFAKVAGIIRSLGGEYVSAGKSSFFKLPKQKVAPTQQATQQTAQTSAKEPLKEGHCQ
jgi:hypothetical protein